MGKFCAESTWLDFESRGFELEFQSKVMKKEGTFSISFSFTTVSLLSYLTLRQIVSEVTSVITISNDIYFTQIIINFM